MKGHAFHHAASNARSSFVPAGAGQVAKFEDLIEEASAELDRVEGQLRTASQEKVVLQNGNAQLMRQAQESAAVKAQASHSSRAAALWWDTGTMAVSSCSCCRQSLAPSDTGCEIWASALPVQQYQGEIVVVDGAHPPLRGV